MKKWKLKEKKMNLNWKKRNDFNLGIRRFYLFLFNWIIIYYISWNIILSWWGIWWLASYDDVCNQCSCMPCSSDGGGLNPSENECISSRSENRWVGKREGNSICILCSLERNVLKTNGVNLWIY